MAARRSHLRILTLGLFTVAAVLVPATRGVAKDVSATTLELSAQTDITVKKRKGSRKLSGKIKATCRAEYSKAADDY